MVFKSNTMKIIIMRNFASSIGRLDVFEWAAMKKERVGLLEGDDGFVENFDDMFDSYRDVVVSNAIDGGHFEFLKYAVVQAGCSFCFNPYNGYDVEFDWTDKLEILEWMTEKADCYGAESWVDSCGGEFCFDAAYNGQLDLLKWAVEHGAEMDDQTLCIYRVVVHLGSLYISGDRMPQNRTTPNYPQIIFNHPPITSLPTIKPQPDKGKNTKGITT